MARMFVTIVHSVFSNMHQCRAMLVGIYILIKKMLIVKHSYKTFQFSLIFGAKNISYSIPSCTTYILQITRFLQLD